MSPKTGRPKIDNPKNVRLEIRMTQEQERILIQCAEKLQISKTEVLMKGLKMVEAENK